MGREETIEKDSQEHPTQNISIDELTERFGETNHLYESRDEFFQDDLAWKHRNRELVEQEVVKRIESEEEGQFTNAILKILSETDSNDTNIQRETEALTMYLIENTDSFYDRLN